MRLESAREDTISNLKSGKKFGIEASAKAFQVLSSNLYERKIEAIVRELGCNASDSHFQAGIPETPFKVTLPTALNPKFVVQDFGLGLSQEEVEEVYTTYFKSTKTGTNDLIGGLGLGSKTPFSYTDSFMVTAIKDGVKCAFTCNIGEDSEPEVNKLFEVQTSEGNGVTVEVSVNETDIYSFISAAAKVYQWFDVKPDTNKELDYRIDEQVVDSLRDYGFYFNTRRSQPITRRYSSSYSRMSAAKVIMGQVSYDLNIDDAMANATKEIKEFVEEMHSLESELYLAMPIGEADVNAGREKLSLDDRTIKNIQAKLEEIRLNLRDTALDKASKFTSVMEADEQLNAVEQKIVYDTVIGGRTLRELKSEVITTDDSAKTPLLEAMDTGFYTPKRGSRGSRGRCERRNTQMYADLKQEKIYTVVVNDCELKGGLIGAVKEEYSLPSSVFVLFDKNTVVTKELKAELEWMFFGRYKIVMASSFWDGSRAAKKKARKIGSESIRCTVIYSHSSNTNTIDFSDVDKDSYAIIQGSARDHIFSVRLNGKLTMLSVGEIRSAMRSLDLEGVVVYNASNETKVKKNFSKVLANEIEVRYNSSDIEKLAMYKAFRRESNAELMILEDYESMVQKIEENYDSMGDKNIAAILSQTVSNSVLDGAEAVIKGRIAVFKQRVELLKKKSKIVEKCLTYSSHDSTMIAELKEYIKTLEQKGK